MTDREREQTAQDAQEDNKKNPALLLLIPAIMTPN